jgi:histone H3/H4
MGELLVVQSKLKELIKKKGCHTSADSVKAFSKVVEDSVNKAVVRAKANGRKTIKAMDL